MSIRFKGAHFPKEINLTCVRGYVVYPLRTRTPPGERPPLGTDCYRSALSHPMVNVVLASPSSAEHMSQALRALELGPMTDDELAWIRRVGAHFYERITTARLVNRA